MSAQERIEFSTEHVAAGDKPDWWAAHMREHLGVDSRVEPFGDQAFEQSIAAWSLGEVAIGTRRGSAFRASWQNSESTYAFADINIEGYCVRRHEGHPEMLMEPRSICVFPLADKGMIFHPDNTTHMILAFPGSLLSEYCPDWESQAGKPLAADGGPAGMLLDWAVSFQRNAEQLGRSCRSAAGRMLLGLLGSAVGAKEDGGSAESSRLRTYHRQRIRQFIETHLADPELSVAKISQAVGLSPRYLHSLFRDEPLHLMQWVQERRLQRCKLELGSAQGWTIAQIAYAYGFNDAAHFSRLFQKRFGRSPREFREENRGATR